jgi:hypothetical protein
MPPKNARKRVAKPSNIDPVVDVTLGEETPPTPSSNQGVIVPIPTLATESSYPLEPLLDTLLRLALVAPLNDTQTEAIQIAAVDDVGTGKMSWSIEMIEQLVDLLYEIFEAGGAADNSFKKTTWERASAIVNKVYKGAIPVTANQCKNK